MHTAGANSCKSHLTSHPPRRLLPFGFSFFLLLLPPPRPTTVVASLNKFCFLFARAIHLLGCPQTPFCAKTQWHSAPLPLRTNRPRRGPSDSCLCTKNKNSDITGQNIHHLGLNGTKQQQITKEWKTRMDCGPLLFSEES